MIYIEIPDRVYQPLQNAKVGINISLLLQYARMVERKIVTSPGGRRFEFPVNLRPDFETFAENTLKLADTEFRDTIYGDVAIGLVAIVFGEANRGATHKEQLEKQQNFIELAIRRNGNTTIIPFLRDKLGLLLTREELALRGS